MSIHWVSFFISIMVMAFVLELVRRERLTFKYAFPWLLIAATALLCSFFREPVFFISRLCGFELPSNFIFFSILSAFVFLSLVLTVFLCQQNKRNDRMAQALGLLELEIRKLKERVDGR